MSGCGFEILDLSGCTSLEKLNASECAAMTTLTLPVSSAQDASVSDSAPAGKLKELSVGGCAELRSLNVSGQSLGHLELDGLKWLTRVQCDGQFIGGVTMSQSMDLKDYAGNGLYRVSDVQGYAADGSPVTTEFNKTTGTVTFASVPADMSRIEELMYEERNSLIDSFHEDDRPGGELVAEYLRRSDELFSGTDSGQVYNGAIRMLSNRRLNAQISSRVRMIAMSRISRPKSSRHLQPWCPLEQGCGFARSK